MVYIHFRDRDVQLLFADVVKKHITIQKAVVVDLPTMMIVNGFIQNEEQFQLFIGDLVEKHALGSSKVIITLDSTFTVYREMSTPLLRWKELEKFIFHTLKQQINTIEDYTVDFAILKKDKKYQILSVAAPNALLHSYQQAFKAAKVSIERITTTPLNLIRGFAYSASMKQKTSSIYLYYNGDIISTVLFNKEEYIFSNVYRTFNSTNPQLTIMERISQLMQFQRSQNNGITVEQVSMFGVVDGFNFDEMAISLGTKIQGESYDEVVINQSGVEYVSFMSALFSGLPSKYRNYNLMGGLNQNQYTAGQDKKEKYALIGFALFANIIFVVFLGIFVYQLQAREQYRYRVYQDRIQNPVLVNHQLEAIGLSTTNAVKEAQLKEFGVVQETLKTNRRFTYALYEQVKAYLPGDVSWNSLSYTQDSLVLQLSAKERTSPFSYARELRGSGLFSDVLYQGFTATKDTYNFQLTLTLKAGE